MSVSAKRIQYVLIGPLSQSFDFGAIAVGAVEVLETICEA